MHFPKKKSALNLVFQIYISLRTHIYYKCFHRHISTRIGFFFFEKFTYILTKTNYDFILLKIDINLTDFAIWFYFVLKPKQLCDF